MSEPPVVGLRLIDLFDKGAGCFPERPFLIDADRSRTYREAQLSSHRIAAALVDHGATSGERAAILSLNSLEAFEAVLSILRAGLIWVPLNPFNSHSEHEELLQRTGVRTLFYHPNLEGAAEALRAACPELVLLVSLEADRMTAFAPDVGERRVDAEQDSDTIVTLFSTGGTTGSAKLVCVSNRAWELMALTSQALFPADDPVHLVAAPMTNAAGGQALAYSPMGMTNVMLPRFEPTAVIDAIRRYRVTHFFLPPTAIYRLLAHPEVETGDYASLRYFTYSSAPMSVDRLLEAVRVFGPVMTAAYGQTETGLNTAHLSPADVAAAAAEGNEARLASVGRAGPAVRIAIMDEAGSLLPPGEQGEVVVRSGQLFSHYYQNDPLLAATRRNGWHLTGDIGRLDSEGYLTLLDRKGDLIISGGFNVYPAEVEKVLLGHPAVEDCAVFGVSEEYWGERVAAAVELRSPAQADEILAWASDRLSRVKAPKALIIVPVLPRSPAGKVLRRHARTLFLASSR